MGAPISQPQSGEWVSSFDLPINHVREEQPRVSTPREKPRMSIVLPFIEREVPQVLRLLDWMAQLSGQLKRTVYLLPFKGLAGKSAIYNAVLRAAEKAFTDVQTISDNEGIVSDWKTDQQMRDAAGPNSLFRQAAWFFHFKPMLGAWLWLEPDCVPLTKTWADDLEAAYIASGKPFFGASMKSTTGDEYLNGAAIYPQNAVTVAPQLVTTTTWKERPTMQVAFDIAGGAGVLRKSELTDLIHLAYRDNGNTPRNGAVLFHGDSADRLIKSLSGGEKYFGESTGVHTFEREQESSVKPFARNGSSKPKALAASAMSAEQITQRKRAYMAKWTALNPEKVRQHARKAHLKKKFGLTPEQYDELFLAQEGRCAICRRPAKTKTSLHVDHCHADGRVRGLLCNNCNIALGLLREDQGTISALSDYLRWTRPTIGDQIRFYVGKLAKLATNANRRARIIKELRKRGLAR